VRDGTPYSARAHNSDCAIPLPDYHDFPSQVPRTRELEACRRIMIEFAALLSAVKPKERSDQYRILAALFHLQAHVTPVSAKRVTDLLRLHCGNKMPSNVNASLRSYTGYVEPVATDSLRLWSLTSKGIDRLRTLSGLALTTASESDAFETDIGIICALEHPELSAVVSVLGGPSAWKEVGNARFAHVYSETEFNTKKGRSLKVVATMFGSLAAGRLNRKIEFSLGGGAARFVHA